MDVGSETDMQRATTHHPDPQTDLAARMRTPVGPQGTNTTAGVELLSEQQKRLDTTSAMYLPT